MPQSGTVKFFNHAKGFGFITPDDGRRMCLSTSRPSRRRVCQDSKMDRKCDSRPSRTSAARDRRRSICRSAEAAVRSGAFARLSRPLREPGVESRPASSIQFSAAGGAPRRGLVFPFSGCPDGVNALRSRRSRAASAPSLSILRKRGCRVRLLGMLDRPGELVRDDRRPSCRPRAPAACRTAANCRPSWRAPAPSPWRAKTR